jgi:cobalamin biosynthesis protein CobD/CbiB
MKVYKALHSQEIEKARYEVSMIVGGIQKKCPIKSAKQL